MSMTREMNHIGMRVCDMNAALHLYRDVLGGVVIRNAGSLDMQVQFVFLQLGGTVMEIITAFEPSQEGYQHVCMLLGPMSLATAYDAMNKAGYEFTTLPKDASSGDGCLAFFKDGSGLEYELLQRVENIRRRPFKTELVKEFAWTTLRILPEEMENTAKLLTEKLGFVAEGDNLFAFNSDRLRLVPVKDGEKPWVDSITLRMNDLQKACDVLRKEGYLVTETEEGVLLYGAGREKIYLID